MKKSLVNPVLYRASVLRSSVRQRAGASSGAVNRKHPGKQQYP